MDISTLLLVVAVVLVLLALFRSRSDISGVEARRLVEAGAQLLDVRSPSEFSGGHLPGAINLPAPEVAKRLGQLGPKERPIVVYCASGGRSAAAAGTLKRAGFTVRNLGPMRRW